MVEDIISKYKSDGVWTSGRLCNFHGCDVSKQGCDIHYYTRFIVRPLTCSQRTSTDGSGLDQVGLRELSIEIREAI